MKNTKFLRKLNHGQSLLEFVILLPLFFFFWMILMWCLIDGLGFMIWNYKVEKYLVCQKNQSFKSFCLEELKNTEKEISWVHLRRFQESQKGRDRVTTLSLEGSFIKNYEIKKYLDQNLWRK